MSIDIVFWSVVGVMFVWMSMHYGFRRGKERDVSEEFVEREREGQDSSHKAS